VALASPDIDEQAKSELARRFACMIRSIFSGKSMALSMP
jgi:hypothetical protein